MYIYIGGMPSKQIDVWRLDIKSGELFHIQTVTDLLSPSFLCKHPSQPLLYAAERSWAHDDKSTGAVTTFRIDTTSGKLTKIGRCRSGGAFTAHVNTSLNGRFLTTANPLGPTVAILPISNNGTPDNPASIITYEDRGALPRQAEPWPHSCYSDKESKRMFVCDLALDRISIYDINPTSGELTPSEQAYAQVSSGAGSRHMALDAQTKYLYIANELDSTISVFHYTAEEARMVIKQTISTVPDDFIGTNQPAEIVLRNDDQFLYITNRGHESIGIFSVNDKDGTLKVVEYAPVLGETPRHLALNNDGTLAAISNQNSHEVVLFNIEQDGRLVPTNGKIPFVNPTCTIFF